MALFEDDDDDDGEVFELDAYDEDMSAMPSPVRPPCFSLPGPVLARTHPPSSYEKHSPPPTYSHPVLTPVLTAWPCCRRRTATVR